MMAAAACISTIPPGTSWRSSPGPTDRVRPKASRERAVRLRPEDVGSHPEVTGADACERNQAGQGAGWTGFDGNKHAAQSCGEPDHAIGDRIAARIPRK